MSDFDDGTTRLFVTASDGVKLAVEATGSGAPIVFVHEFAGDIRSWEPQVRHFSRSHRCITYNARGYPPSEVPEDGALYSQMRAADDVADVITGLSLKAAHVVGCSMGAFATFHLMLRRPELVLSATLAGIGYGAPLDKLDAFRGEALATADQFAKVGMAEVAKTYSVGPARVQFQNRDPRGWAEFARDLAGHSTRGAELTMRGLQARRPSIYEFAEAMAACDRPVLVVVGDEDEAALEASLFLKRGLPRAGLVAFARTGHGVNLEEPARFNAEVADFLRLVDAGAWGARDPRSRRASALGMSETKS